ncbi:MAG: conjugative transfer signal peptidase TraF [Bryobacteraceae bacterium]
MNWVTPGLCSAALVAAFGVGGLRLNATYSLPLGIYRTTPDPSARLIEFCPTGLAAIESTGRGYRGRSWSCPDGEAPLLKPIVATEGDIVETTPAGIVVNGRVLPNTAPLFRDSQGRELTPWPFGAYVVDSGHVWVASTYNKGSYDSRYLGPIPLTAIRARLKPVFTYNPGGQR